MVGPIDTNNDNSCILHPNSVIQIIVIIIIIILMTSHKNRI